MEGLLSTGSTPSSFYVSPSHPLSLAPVLLPQLHVLLPEPLKGRDLLLHPLQLGLQRRLVRAAAALLDRQSGHLCMFRYSFKVRQFIHVRNDIEKWQRTQTLWAEISRNCGDLETKYMTKQRGYF